MQQSRPRLVALDVLRGLAVAGMIVVNSPGDWNATYAPLLHANWHGWTATDIVFPTFLFAMGVAVALSFPHPPETSDDRKRTWLRVARRTAALIALGLFLNWTMQLPGAVLQPGPPFAPDMSLAHLRIPGVLQRIALCYLLAFVIVVATAARGDKQIALRPMVVTGAVALILVGYWALLTFVPVPGHGAGSLDPEGSLPAYVDRLVFSPAHLWALGSKEWAGPVTYDPEGLVSTAGALANVLIGVLAGWMHQRWRGEAWTPILLFGALLVAAGVVLDPLLPINKRIWTSSFALLSSGLSAIAFSAVLLVMKAAVGRKLLHPMEVLGGNAILGFTLSILLGVVSGLPFLRWNGEAVGPQAWGNNAALAVIGDPYLASLACALCVLVFVLALIWPLHRRDIHLRL